MPPVVATFYSPEYAHDAQRLRVSVERCGYDYDEVRVDSPDTWESGCAGKAAALLTLLERHERIVYLDADEWLVEPIPWLTEFDGDLALAYTLPPKEGQTWRSQRYRVTADRFGHRYLSGVMALNGNERTLAMIQEWARLCEEYPNDWDEAHLFRACQKTGLVPERVPDDYRVIPVDRQRTRIAHASGSIRHWRAYARSERELRKILIIGSAPDAPEWWAKNGDRWLDAAFSVVCINNAWRAIPTEHVHYWIRPNDFKGEHPPECVPRNSALPRYKADSYRMWYAKPDWDSQVQTTFTHALYHLSNMAKHDQVRLAVHCVGCDFDYERSQTHFYEGGQRDPLRYGVPALTRALSKLHHVYTMRGHVIFNAGGHEPTLLPFLRVSTPKTISYGN